MQIAIMDCDGKAAADLKDKISRYCSEASIRPTVHVFADGFEFLRTANVVYDVIFVDMKMPVLSGLELAKKIREVDAVVPIILTADTAAYAIKGYKVDAADYFIKPIDYAELSFRLNKINNAAQKFPDHRILIKVPNSGIKIFSIKDLLYVEVDDQDVTYHTVSGNYTARGCLKNIEAELDSSDFAKCSASYLINLSRVKEVKADTVLIGNDELKISRRLKKPFIEALLKIFPPLGGKK